MKRSDFNASENLTIPEFTVNKDVDLEEFQSLSQNPAERINWAKALLRMPQVWLATQGKDITVAVLDTGIDLGHPDLQQAIVDTMDFTGDGIEDVNGHGTHCAGIIAARANHVGFIGAAPKADLLIAKVLNNQGRGNYSWISDGIKWAVSQGADVISISLGGGYSDPVLYNEIQSALAKGVTIVCAAGNSGSLYSNSIGYPGKYGGVITIASHDWNGNASGLSSHSGEIDFMAPGQEIWSTYRDGRWAKLSGTSMATPFVAGIAALILSHHKHGQHHNTPVNNCDDIRNHLKLMAAHPGYHSSERGYGPLLPFQNFFPVFPEKQIEF